MNAEEAPASLSGVDVAASPPPGWPASGLRIRQPRHAGRRRRRARRAAARGDPGRGRRGCSARRCRRDRCAGRGRGGVPMSAADRWQALPHRGRRRRRRRAVRPATGGWRTGVKPQVGRSQLRELPALLALLPGLGREARRHDLRRLRPRLLQGLRDLRRGLPGRRDRDGRRTMALTLAAAHRRRGGRRGDAPDRPGRRAGLPDHAADADHPGLREVRRGRAGARASSSTSSRSTRR